MNTTRTRLVDVLEHAEEQGGFLTRQDVDELSVVDRLHMVLVRCNAGRFTCPAQDALHFCKLVEHDGTEWVRDISFLAGDLWLLTLAELRVQRDRDECRRVQREVSDAFNQSEYGGAFDGFAVTSDADPGL